MYVKIVSILYMFFEISAHQFYKNNDKRINNNNQFISTLDTLSILYKQINSINKRVVQKIKKYNFCDAQMN
jgi:hypothetical protein